MVGPSPEWTKYNSPGQTTKECRSGLKKTKKKPSALRPFSRHKPSFGRNKDDFQKSNEINEIDQK
jgi:hypothetical protein